MGSALGAFTPADIADAWLVRSRCRDVWSDLLGDILQKQDALIKEALLELEQV